VLTDYTLELGGAVVAHLAAGPRLATGPAAEELRRAANDLVHLNDETDRDTIAPRLHALVDAVRTAAVALEPNDGATELHQIAGELAAAIPTDPARW
jgi:hypothetical protein